MIAVAKRPTEEVRIATYNVNGVRGRLPRLLEWLAETSPDIACLQEIKTSDDRVPASAVEGAGYHALWHGQRAHHGVAILARHPLRERRRGLPGDSDDRESRYVEADVQGLVVASVYLPNGNPQPGPRFDYKLAWMERLLVHARTLVDLPVPVVLAGDFNVVPTNRDIYNAGAWRFDAVLQPQTRAAWQRLLAQGWTDATRHAFPDQRVYTFWVNDEAFRRDAGFRMDFLLLNRAALATLTATGIDREHRGRAAPSDHTPVWADLNLSAAARDGHATATRSPSARTAGRARAGTR